jgi:hypothetical protein
MTAKPEYLKPAEEGLDPAAGACNLLQNCIAAQPGDRLLIIGEEHGIGYYDDRVCDVVAETAHSLDIETKILRAPTASGPDDIPEQVIAAMQQVDHTLFLSRLGDQLRFAASQRSCSRTMCYTLDLDYLGSEFARTPWTLYKQVHDRLLNAILAAGRYRITCPLGSDLEGEVPQQTQTDAVTGFTVNVFPVVIYPPLKCVGVNGRLVLDRFLLSTSINSFANSVLPLEQPVVAHIENSRITGFEGNSALTERVEQQYRRVGDLTGGDPFALNSWHSGIYPKTFYSADPYTNIQRWGDVAFASPRYTHFHTCGTAPGNIATATFDTTITFDDEIFWDQGRLAFLDRPELQALLQDYPETPDAYGMRWDIGL